MERCRWKNIYTDREYFIYHFPMLENYIEGVKKNLGNQNETSLVLGIDFYHYGENWWLHTWGNWLPVHYGHDLRWPILLVIVTTSNKMVNHMSLNSKTLSKHDWNDYDMGANIWSEDTR